jgi:hypothetical protein
VVENFVDNFPAPSPKPRVGEPPVPSAQKYGMKISFSINDLHRRDAARRTTTVSDASVGAAVELSHGAGHCFVDG